MNDTSFKDWWHFYRQAFKVLKPGGVFGVYEWLMTDDYDASNPKHREICHGIEMQAFDKSIAIYAVAD